MAGMSFAVGLVQFESMHAFIGYMPLMWYAGGAVGAVVDGADGWKLSLKIRHMASVALRF